MQTKETTMNAFALSRILLARRSVGGGGAAMSAEEATIKAMSALAASRLLAVVPKRAAIDSSVNTIEFSMRENNTGRFPRGLSLMLRSLSAWLYEGDPVMPLRFEEPLAQLKERMAKEDVFTPLIKKLLIENKHQVTIELNPDKQMAKAQEDAENSSVDNANSSVDTTGDNAGSFTGLG